VIEASFVSLCRRYDRLPTEVECVAEAIGRDVLTRGKAWICGGSVRRAITGQESRADIDIYTTGDAAADEVADALLKAGFERVKSVRKNTVFRSADAKRFGRAVLIDLSRRVFHPSPEECINSFDYTICQFALFYDGDDLKVIHTVEAIHDLINGVLMPVPDGIKSGEQMRLSLMRATKYFNQGFIITPQALATMAEISAAVEG